MTVTESSPNTSTVPAHDVGAPVRTRPRAVVAGWAAVGVGVVAAGALAVVVATDDGPARVDTSRVVIEHGSISAIDHGDALIVARRTAASEAVAEHGSINAIDHRDMSAWLINRQLAWRGRW